MERKERCVEVWIASKIVLRQTHDHRVDCWSLEVIMYELLLGQTPSSISSASTAE